MREGGSPQVTGGFHLRGFILACLAAHFQNKTQQIIPAVTIVNPNDEIWKTKYFFTVERAGCPTPSRNLTPHARRGPFVDWFDTHDGLRPIPLAFGTAVTLPCETPATFADCKAPASASSYRDIPQYT